MGELARKPGAPGLPLTPEELLTPGPGEGYSWIEKNIPPVFTAVIASGAPALLNLHHRRPFFAGIYRHMIFGGVGYIVGHFLFEIRRAQNAEKDAILRHYVSLHPEDFPPIERKRYKDIFVPWTPIR